jgi:hypothetical protein
MLGAGELSMQGKITRSALWRFLALLAIYGTLLGAAQGAPQSGGDFSTNPDAKKLPTETILVKGAWSSVSDSVTPVPEGGRVSRNIYNNAYFGLAYPLSPDWTEKYSGPPPSDSGYYVLAQIRPADTYTGASRGSILIAAQDLFFTLTPAGNAFELINYTKDHLYADYKVERPPTPVTVAGRSFVRLDYFSPVAELHWHVLATQIRCHMVQFVFTSRDTKLIESLIQDMNAINLPPEAGAIVGTGGGDAPLCIKDYARDENIMERDDPVFTERRFNSVPVRVIIDKEGKVKHIHFLSAFPDQAKSIADALAHWRFRPYLRDGQPVEVETGIMFGHPPRLATPPSTNAVSE